jgi:hypothetical protein
MKITQENYYSAEAEQEYLTCSQVKTYLDCPARWQASRSALVKPAETPALFSGNYVDCALTEPDKFAEFCVLNKEKIYNKGTKDKKSGLYPYKDKKADIVMLDNIIARVRRDEKFMEFLTGESQLIITIDDFYGHKYKCRLDIVDWDNMRIVDLKTCRDIDAEEWVKLDSGKNVKVPWIAYWRYPMQLALYREAIRQKFSVKMRAYIAAVEKKDVPGFRIFDMTNENFLNAELKFAVGIMDRMKQDKDKSIDDIDRCGKCEWCKSTMSIKEPVMFEYDDKFLQF